MKPISKTTAHSQAYSELKQAIMSAYFEPGEIITLRSLGTLLGTSDMPVREALKRLVAERAVETLPNRSTRIPVLSAERMREIIDLRVMLEAHAAGLAAKNATEEDLTTIRKNNDAAMQCLENDDGHGYLHHNAEFHFAIYRASGMDTIIPLIESLWLQYAPTFSVSLRFLSADPGALARVGKNHHLAIIEALEQRDAKQASRVIEDDIKGPTKIEGFWDKLASPMSQRESDESRRGAALSVAATRTIGLRARKLAAG